MTRKPSRKTKKARIQQALRLARTLYGLESWNIEVTFYGKISEMPEAEQCKASCTASPEYQEASLVFVLDEIGYDEIPHFVTHELMHIPLWWMTDPLDRWAGTDPERVETARRALESSTTMLDRLVTPIVSAYLDAEDAETRPAESHAPADPASGSPAT